MSVSFVQFLDYCSEILYSNRLGFEKTGVRFSCFTKKTNAILRCAWTCLLNQRILTFDKKRYPFSEHRCSERQQWCNVTMSTCTDVNVNLKFSSKFWSIRSELQILSEFTHSPTPIFETPTAPSPQIHAMLRLRREASQLRFISFQLDVCARDVDVDRSEKGERELVWEFRESSKEINFLLDQNGHVAQW
jgi:hypothetical protein